MKLPTPLKPSLHVLFSSLLSLSAVGAAVQALAQSTVPFGAAVFNNSHLSTDKAAILDVDRDGSPDFVGPGFLMGTATISLDEGGAKVGEGSNFAIRGPLIPSPVLPSALILAGGRLDADYRADLVALTNDGALHFLPNKGSTELSKIRFSPGILLDDLSSILPTPSLSNSNTFSVLEVLDFDADGFNDVLLAGGQANYWIALTSPGFVAFYKGNGAGSFQKFSLNLPGVVVDGKHVDLNNDGVNDHFAILTETGGAGAFSYEMHHLSFQNNALSFVGFPQVVRLSRVSSFDMANVMGTTDKDYIFSVNISSGSGLSSSVYVYEGNGSGVVGSNWMSLYLPPNSTGLGDHIESLKVADFDGDGNDDIAVLRGYSLPAPSGTNNPAQVANADLFIAMGPQLFNSSFTTLALPGRIVPNFANQSTSVYMGEPQVGTSRMLQVLDLGSELRPDLAILNVFRPSGPGPNPSMQYGAITLKNQRAPSAPDAGLEKVGYFTGGVPGFAGRIGFDGGRPTVGNSNFSVTLSNVRGGALVGLMWGSFGQPSLMPISGIELHTTPDVFGNLGTASGAGLGTGFYNYPMPIPNNPALVGHSGYFQYNYIDIPTGRIGGTQATGVNIGR